MCDSLRLKLRLHDIQVTDADAPSYLSQSVANVLTMAEEEKKHKCVTAAAEARHV